MTQSASPLPITLTTVLEVDYGPLECLIAQHYGLPYSIAVALEAKNGSYFKVTVAKTHQQYNPDAAPGSKFTTRDGLDPEAEEAVRAWRDSGAQEPGINEVLHDLACSNVIPTGTYLIRVSW
ncbi:hypothetical protein ABT173_46455 [Streptomyces sp. NPDC001795]|uniref:hypothetical protein n=1 Tax=Streptomyces sp. NPDC001795 TaxID=3154525 RepID=UPI00332F6442